MRPARGKLSPIPLSENKGADELVGKDDEITNCLEGRHYRFSLHQQRSHLSCHCLGVYGERMKKPFSKSIMTLYVGAN